MNLPELKKNIWHHFIAQRTEMSAEELISYAVDQAIELAEKETVPTEAMDDAIEPRGGMCIEFADGFNSCRIRQLQAFSKLKEV